MGFLICGDLIDSPLPPLLLLKPCLNPGLVNDSM